MGLSFGRWVYPHGRLNKVYRGVYETVILDNIKEGEIKDDKFFNSFELQAKYEYKFKKLNSYCFYLGSFSSAQSMFSPPFVVLSEDAYIRQYVNR